MKPTPGGPFNSYTDALNSGGICPMGKYCETGVAVGSNCGQNKFLPFFGAIISTDCQSCPVGKYCATPGLDYPTGDCSAGYYCPASSISSTASACAQDYYCELGTLAPIKCPPGTYTTGTGFATCTACSDGKVCSGYGVEVNCPLGYYCKNDI